MDDLENNSGNKPKGVLNFEEIGKIIAVIKDEGDDKKKNLNLILGETFTLPIIKLLQTKECVTQSMILNYQATRDFSIA